jgi:hypothetical protein
MIFSDAFNQDSFVKMDVLNLFLFVCLFFPLFVCFCSDWLKLTRSYFSDWHPEKIDWFCLAFEPAKTLDYFGIQGCQMVCFQTKNPNLGQFWSALDWKIFIYFMAICNILWTFGIFYDHLAHFAYFWYIFSGFGFMYLEKSGSPASDSSFRRR